MRIFRTAIAGITLSLLAASASAQQFPTVPDRTVIGRIGTGSSSGPSQAIPFATLLSRLASPLPVLNGGTGLTAASGTSLPLFSTGATAGPLAYRAIVGTDLPNPSTTTLGAVFSAPVSSNSVLSGIGNDGQPTFATTTGTGNVVRAISPGITTTLTVTGANTKVFAAGRLGATTPALQVNSAAANQITGIVVTGQSSGNGVNFSATGETNVPLAIDAAGSGAINVGSTSTGLISLFRNTLVNNDTNPTLTLGSVGGSLAHLTTPGTSGMAFTTNSSTDQVNIVHTASATRQVTLTGSNGGNPTISTTAGNLAITPALVLTGGLASALPTASGGTNLTASTDVSTTFVNRALSVQNSGDTNDCSSGSGSFRAYNLTYTIPASFLVNNRALRIMAHYRLTTGTVPTGLEFQLKMGGTLVSHYGPNTPTASVTNVQIMNQWIVQATAAPGAAAAVETAMVSNLNGLGSFTVGSDTVQPVNLATNGTLAITIESKWASACTGTTQAKLSQFIVEAIN